MCVYIHARVISNMNNGTNTYLYVHTHAIKWNYILQPGTRTHKKEPEVVTTITRRHGSNLRVS